MIVLIHINVNTLMACAPIPAKPPLKAFFDALLRMSDNDGAGLLCSAMVGKRKDLARAKLFYYFWFLF